MQSRLLSISFFFLAFGDAACVVSAQGLHEIIETQKIEIWSADHETGNLNQWQGIWTSGDVAASISTRHAHSGTYAAALTIYNADGTFQPERAVPAVRMAVNHIDVLPDEPLQALLPIGASGSKSRSSDLPDEAYYSVWYFFPQHIEAPIWWNVFQWKRKWVTETTKWSDPTYTVNVGNRENGAMRFHLYSHVSQNGQYEPVDEAERVGVGRVAIASVDIPLQRWVQLECFYRWSVVDNGAIQCWQDGEKLWDIQDVITEYDYEHIEESRQWTVNNYSRETNPSTHVLYIDNAKIKVPVIESPQ